MRTFFQNYQFLKCKRSCHFHSSTLKFNNTFFVFVQLLYFCFIHGLARFLALLRSNTPSHHKEEYSFFLSFFLFLSCMLRFFSLFKVYVHDRDHESDTCCARVLSFKITKEKWKKKDQRRVNKGKEEANVLVEFLKEKTSCCYCLILFFWSKLVSELVLRWLEIDPIVFFLILICNQVYHGK